MSLLGQRLQQEREARGLALLQVELDTRIRANVLQALEDGELEKLPPEPFLRGLIRSYANYLRIDPQEMLDLYAADTIPAPAAAPRGHFVRRPSAAPHPPAVRPPSFDEARANTQTEIERPAEPVQPPPEPTKSTPLPSSVPEPLLRRRLPLAPPSPKPKKPVLPIPKTSPPPSLPPETLPPPERLAPEPTAITETVLVPVADIALEPMPESVPAAARRPRSIRLPRRILGMPVPSAILFGIAIVFGLLALGLFASSRLVPTVVSFVAGQPTATLTRIPRTATPTGVPGATPTSVHTIAATAPPFATLVGNPTPGPSVKATPLRTTTNLNLDIAATQLVTVQVGIDGLMVFNGPMTPSTSQSWSAKESLYVRVENFVGAAVSFNGKKQGALNFGERSLFERQWVLNPGGKVVAVTPQRPSNTAPTATPAPISISSNPLPTVTASPAATNTPTSTPAPTKTPSGPTRTLTPFF